MTVRELARLARVAPGTVSKVLRTLDDAGVLARSERAGRFEQVYKRHLVERWVQDYTFVKANRVGWYLAPRGLQSVLDEVAGAGARVAVTGSYAAQRLLPRSTVPLTAMTQLALYVSDIESAAGALELVETTPPSANVLLAQPYDVELLSTRNDTGGDLVSVGPGQTVADLLTMPGRARQEAEQLMDALASEDRGWR
ncbi:hypothetical protein JQS43_20330 [Natronosporangium hydrolyticum]|uniref:Uncharacterized protein n=1 Tax=Natronosporangium hydrolyticum TaxID=2811111 RepID=A0A895Y826_9ACTN|nr:hypothetical protein [Natronosporangium hydrolyticum]QSB13874.1 hypothetical protein JQS43_20330 [Natronosporangium hydrolyticum]